MKRNDFFESVIKETSLKPRNLEPNNPLRTRLEASMKNGPMPGIRNALNVAEFIEEGLVKIKKARKYDTTVPRITSLLESLISQLEDARKEIREIYDNEG